MCDGLPQDYLNQLLHRWLAGDEQAAAKLWRHHAGRLIGLARKSLSAEMARQVDPEDVVQSVYLQFFSAARSSNLALRHHGDLWRFLVAIMRNKMRDQHKRQHALKRKGDEDGDTKIADLEDRQPTPGEQAALSDELDRLLDGFTPRHKRMVPLRLEGWKVEEIAGVTDNNERTVRRVLKRVQRYLRHRCAELED